MGVCVGGGDVKSGCSPAAGTSGPSRLVFPGNPDPELHQANINAHEPGCAAPAFPSLRSRCGVSWSPCRGQVRKDPPH